MLSLYYYLLYTYIEPMDSKVQPQIVQVKIEGSDSDDPYDLLPVKVEGASGPIKNEPNCSNLEELAYKLEPLDNDHKMQFSIDNDQLDIEEKPNFGVLEAGNLKVALTLGPVKLESNDVDLEELAYKHEPLDIELKTEFSIDNEELLNEDKPDLVAVGAPSESNKFQCSMCYKTFEKKEHLKKHQLMHRDSLWKCSKSSFKTQHQLSPKGRLLLHKDPSETDMLHCDSCSYSSKRLYDLWKHIIQQHTQDPSISTPAEHKNIRCSMCCKTFKDKETLRTHLLVHKEQPSSENTTIMSLRTRLNQKLRSSVASNAPTRASAHMIDSSLR